MGDKLEIDGQYFDIIETDDSGKLDMCVTIIRQNQCEDDDTTE